MSLTFGEKIKEARKHKNLTQRQLADLIGAAHNSISDWENNKNKPDPDTIELLCGVLKITPNYLLASSEEDFSPSEKLLIKRYRGLDEYGKRHIDYELNREVERVEKMQSLESSQTAVIEFHGKADDTNRLLEYFRSASAGSGVFILGNEASEQIAIPNTPENQYADFAIGVDGNSMEPDYHDGDIVLVSQKLELNHGDVGIFIINNKAYIKEYGETELISRNPAANNITISEYDNIVCMGKVIGKLP